MERRRRALPEDPVRGPDGARSEEGPRTPETARVVAALDDAAAARLLRHQLREGPLAAIPRDDVIGPHLDPSELLVTVRRHGRIEVHPPGAPVRTLNGDVYVTSRRLVVTGSTFAAWDLGRVREADVTDRQLLLLLHDGTGIAVTVDRPVSLRVEVQAARLGRIRG